MACLSAAAETGRPPRERRLLIAVGCLGIVFSIAETLGLGGWLAHAGRSTAANEGWYGGRRPIQAMVIVGIAALTLGAVFTLGLLTRGFGRVIRTVIVLFAALVGFIAIRTISLHQVDAYLYHELVYGLPVGTLVESAIVAAMSLVLLLFSGPPALTQPHPNADAYSSERQP